MTREQIKNELHQYKMWEARIAYLEDQISDERYNDAYGQRVLDGLPADAGVVGDPTQRIAVQLTNVDMGRARREIDMLRTKMRKVEKALEALTYMERWVVERHEIQGRTWAQMIDDQEANGSVVYSISGMRKSRNQAIRKICAVWWQIGKVAEK